MVFNFTNNYQFNTRLILNNEILETVSQTKLLGTVLTNDLKWDQNTDFIVKKSYARMEILRKLSSFKAPISDMKQIFIVYIRSILEQSSNVWHSGLTVQNENDLERVQKVALKIILKDKYQTYESALNLLDLETLKERRNNLCLIFAKKCLKNPKMQSLFPPNNRTHPMDIRNHKHFQVDFAHTERMKDSTILYMQNLLNNEVKERKGVASIWNI